LLRLGSEHRMNVPSADHGQWRWRFSWPDVGSNTAADLLRITRLYGRAEPPAPQR